MLSYFFLPALLSGIVGLQTDNSSTSADKDEVRRVERPVLLLSNQTLNLTTEDDGVMKPANVSKLEELELELERTGTFNVTMEDDEHFQDQEQIYSPLHCDEETMEMLSYQLCASKFYMVMMNISTEHRCDLDHIIRGVGARASPVVATHFKQSTHCSTHSTHFRTPRHTLNLLAKNLHYNPYLRTPYCKL